MANRSSKSDAKSSTKKPKLVRDSFSIPKNEFAAIDALKLRAIALGTSVKKSELLRAGLMALQGMGDAAFKAAVAAVPTLKTGRPAKDMPAKAAPKAAAKTPAPSPAPAPVKAAAQAVPRARRAAVASAKAPVKAVTKKAAAPSRARATRRTA